jgi:drug/metabolite transporter (DMT)-like permease
MKQNHKKLISSLMLVLAALIWGTAFVAQRKGMEYTGPLAFNGVRTIIGALVLLPVALIFRPAMPVNKGKTLLAGVLCGLALFAATNLQQIGLVTTDAGKTGFITTFYIILVPVLGLFLGKKTGAVTWLAVAVALGGLYCLCMKSGEMRIAPGDLLVLGCAFFFAVQILVIDRFVQEVDGVLLSCLQFAVNGVLSLAAAFIFEKPDFPALFRGWIPLLYTGILSCGVAYTLQILGQKNLHPTVASLLMSLESAFAVLGGWLILHERLSRRELLGCSLMLAAVLLVQLAPAKKEKAPAS